jgi:hypothetical protein
MNKVRLPAALGSCYRNIRRWGKNISSLQGLKQALLTPNGLNASNSRPATCIPVKTTAVPAGFRLYASGLRVDGLHYRRAAAQDFARCRQISIELEPASKNHRDADAIKVIGIGKSRRYFIGYVPRDASARIAESGLTNDVRAQLEYISQASDEVIAVHFQLILPEEVAQGRSSSI